MSDLLKPCPFCGGEPQFVEDNISEAGLVDCKQCGVTTNVYETDTAIRHWNTRVEQPALHWTKEPPTEKDLGKWFLVRRVIHDDDSGLDYTKVEILKLQIWAEFGLVFNYLEVTKWSEDIQAEFLGPLPE